MKFCIEFVGEDHPHNMRLMGEDPRTEQLIEEMELCFAGYSPSKDMDVYAITPGQAVDFISRYFGIVQLCQTESTTDMLARAVALQDAPGRAIGAWRARFYVQKRRARPGAK